MIIFTKMPPDPKVRHKQKLVVTLNPVILIIIVLLCAISSISSSTSNSPGEGNSESSPSLFDSLPLNGALVIDSNNLPSLQRNPLERLRRRFPHNHNGTLHLVKIKRKIKKSSSPPPAAAAETAAQPQQRQTGEGVKSLFDLLPAQGAMLLSESNDIKSHEGNNSNPRNQRSSPAKRHHFDNFEIERQKPTSEFSLSFFNTKLIPPIIKSLTQNDGPPPKQHHARIPILASPSVHLIQPLEPRDSYQGPPPGNGNPAATLSGAYGPPPHIFLRHPPPPPSYNHPQHYNNAMRLPQDNYNKKPSTSSTVIIYADPHHHNNNNNNQPNHFYNEPPPSHNSYGPPPPYTTTTTTTTTTPAPAKNEIHYHYHINNNKPNDQSTTEKPKEPQVVYGVPQQPPPKTQYKAPSTGRRPGNRQPNSYYGPPPSRNRGGYAPSKSQQQGGYQQQQQPQSSYNAPPQQQQQQTSQGGYESSSNTPQSNDEAVVPILSGNRKNTKPFRNSDVTEQAEDDYNDSDDDSRDDDDRFKSRTLFTINRYQQQQQQQHHQQHQPQQYQSQQNENPSSNYGSLPLSTFSTSYGPPAPQQQQQPYGPPPSLQPPPPANDDPPQPIQQSQSAQTSITIETIPITTTETRLVAVPKITQTLGGTSQQAQFDPGNNNNQHHSSSGGYGSYNNNHAEPPAPPTSSNNNNNNNNNLGSPPPSQNSRNILNEQLLQLAPARGGLPDFTDIETLTLLQSQNAQRHNNPLLTELLLNQVQQNLRGGGGGGSGHHGSLFSNSPSDLRTSVLSTHSAGLRNIGFGGALGGGSIPLTGGVTVNNLPLLAAAAGGGQGGFQIGNLRGGGTVLTGDAVGAISDLIREQKLQLAVSDLRSRLRFQNRDAERTRQNYRSLFYKGALLLAGLSLIPTVATVASPGYGLAAAVGGMHSASALSLSSLLPLTTGRRRRRETGHDDDNMMAIADMGRMEIPLEEDVIRRVVDPSKQLYLNNKKFVINSTNQSLFDSMAFKGALIPISIRKNLEKYLPPDEILKNSQCIQKYFCESLLQIERLPNPTPFLLLLAGFSSGDMDKNPWLREAMTAAKNDSCAAFYCHNNNRNVPTTKKKFQRKVFRKKSY